MITNDAISEAVAEAIVSSFNDPHGDGARRLIAVADRTIHLANVLAAGTGAEAGAALRVALQMVIACDPDGEL